MALKNNTWKLKQWYDQSVAGNAGYSAFNNGEFWTWGTNEQGQLGQNNTTDYSSPKQVPGTTWKLRTDEDTGANDRKYNITSQGGSTYAIKTDGTLWAWGENENGGLLQNDTVDRSSPTQIPGNWTSTMGGTRNGMAILAIL